MPNQQDPSLQELQYRWIRPRTAFATAAYALLYVVNWLSVRLLFRLSVEGREWLPTNGPLILAPNHASPLDPPILAASLPLKMLQQTFWAGKQKVVLRNPLRRILSWLTRVLPIEDNGSAIAPCVAVLERGQTLVWFPEGRRSRNGQLQKLKSGIAHLLVRCDVPVVPVFIQGAYAAFPSGARFPRLRTRVVVRIGPALSAEQLGLNEPTAEGIHRLVETLRASIERLRDESEADLTPDPRRLGEE